MAGTDHNNLTGASAVHPTAYIQSTDPGAVGANKEWIDTSGSTRVRWLRNSTNTGWVTIINPMTAVGDLVRGGTSGNPTRVAIGTEGHVLTVVSGVPAWAGNSGSALYLSRTLY